MLRILILFSILSINQAVSANEYKIRKLSDEKEELAGSVLRLALSKIDSDFKLVEDTEAKTEERLVQAIEDGQLDILWAGANPDKESRMLTVRIPLLKGLLGHRIFIIRQDDQKRFSTIRTREDLDNFFAGQGTFWGDTAVLKNANIPTVTTIKYHNLFPMLEGGRFDYFPRAVHEPWPEIERHAHLNLKVEENVMLVYPFALWFYVNKDNKALHDKIYQGFEMAINDGSYDELFFSNPLVKSALNNANLGQRRVFRIDNPFMHPDTPTDRPEFWLDLSKL